MAPWESEQQHCGSNYWAPKKGAAGHSASRLCAINMGYWQVAVVITELDVLRLLNFIFCKKGLKVN
jgi:hypothetical protein